MGDYAVIAAALAGAVVGLLLMRSAVARDVQDRVRVEASPAGEPPTPTEYEREPAHTAVPVLLAAGIALTGVGLAFGSGDDGLDARLLIPGAAVLLAALVADVRRRY